MRNPPNLRQNVTAHIVHKPGKFQVLFVKNTASDISWLVEQGLTSHSTQLTSFRRRCFYSSDDPTNSVKALKEGG